MSTASMEQELTFALADACKDGLKLIIGVGSATLAFSQVHDYRQDDDEGLIHIHGRLFDLPLDVRGTGVDWVTLRPSAVTHVITGAPTPDSWQRGES